MKAAETNNSNNANNSETKIAYTYKESLNGWKAVKSDMQSLAACIRSISEAAATNSDAKKIAVSLKIPVGGISGKKLQEIKTAVMQSLLIITRDEDGKIKPARFVNLKNEEGAVDRVEVKIATWYTALKRYAEGLRKGADMTRKEVITGVYTIDEFKANKHVAGGDTAPETQEGEGK